MIVWLFLFGMLLLVLTLPAQLFGYVVGRVVSRLMKRARSPPKR